MAVHALDDGFVILFYNSNGHNHKHIIPIKNPIDSGGGVYTVDQASGSALSLITAMTTLVTAMKPLFPAAATFQYWELWVKPTPDADPVFKQTADLSIVGTNGAGAVPYGQVIYSYRTRAGGNGKVQFQESSLAANFALKPPYASPHTAVVTYLLGTGNIYAGRDGSFIASVPKVNTKTNDKLRKKFLLNV